MELVSAMDKPSCVKNFRGLKILSCGGADVKSKIKRALLLAEEFIEAEIQSRREGLTFFRRIRPGAQQRGQRQFIQREPGYGRQRHEEDRSFSPG